jgi:hypothetical protein
MGLVTGGFWPILSKSATAEADCFEPASSLFGLDRKSRDATLLCRSAGLLKGLPYQSVTQNLFTNESEIDDDYEPLVTSAYV